MALSVPRSDGYAAMLMSPEKGETAVHGCHCPGDVAVYALGTGKAVWYSVSVNCCCLLMLQLEITCQSVHTLLTERQFFSSSYISVTDKVLALAEG